MKTLRFRLGILLFFLSALTLTGCGSRDTQVTPTPTIAPPISEETAEPKPPDPLFAREAALAYMRTNYSESAPPEDLAWAEAEVTPEGLVGATSFQYSAGDWLVTVSYPVVAPEALVYQVEASDASTGFHWRGTVDANGEVTPSGFVAYLYHEDVGEDDGISVELTGLTGLVAFHLGRIEPEEVRDGEDF